MVFSITELETFPFPIASIINLYEAKMNPRLKFDHLFDFFEALTEFISIILLSPFSMDTEYFFKEFKAIKNNRPDWFKTPSFGDWILINRTITKSLRRLKEDNTAFKKCCDKMGNPSEAFLEAITDKSIYNILDNVKNDRNYWKGHGSFLGERKINELLPKHNENLKSLKTNLISLFSSFELIQAKTIKYQEGVFNHEVKSIMGSSHFFKTKIIKLKIPMEYDQLYILHKGSERPIKLIPYIKFIRGPKTNNRVFYFYNRIDRNQIRYLSYHNEDDSENYLDLNPEIKDVFLLFQTDYKPKVEKVPKTDKKMGKKYWEIFNDLLTKFKNEKPGSTYRSSTVDNWLGLPVGTTGFHLEWYFIGTEPNKKLEIGIHLENEFATINHKIFEFLNNQKAQFTKIFGDEVIFLKEWIKYGEWSKIYILKDIETLDRFMHDQKLKDWAFDNMVKFYDLYMKYQKEIRKQVYQMRSSIKKN